MNDTKGGHGTFITYDRRSSMALGLLVLFTVTSASIAVAATDQDDLVSALKLKYPITETTPDRSQISQPGIVMRIVKNGISAQPWDAFITFDNPIADGAVQHHSRWVELEQSTQAKLGQSKNVLALKPGDTVYITKIESKSESKDDLLKISILSCDPLDVDNGASQKRYAATISFKMPKNSLAENAPDQIEQMLEAVLQPDVGDTGNNHTATRTKPATAAPAPRPTQSALSATALAAGALNPFGVLSRAALSQAAPTKAASHKLLPHKLLKRKLLPRQHRPPKISSRVKPSTR